MSDLIKNYTFELPEELIAQEPSAMRENARLLVIRRNPEKGLPQFEDLLIKDLPQLARETPILNKSLWLRNRSRVLPARFYAERPTGSRHEIVLLEEIENGIWSALIRNSAKMSFPQILYAENSKNSEGSKSSEKITALAPDRIDMRALSKPLSQWLEEKGEMPLPPYIKSRSQERDRERYQTVWSLEDEQKSVAAPTASLHFTNELVQNIESAGVQFADCVLHVGLGTFEPVRVEKLSEHTLHDERIFVSQKNAALLLEHLRQSRGVLSIGTTAMRTLESLSLLGEDPRENTQIQSSPEGDLTGRTRLFIRPDFEFRYSSALLTNFHLPESTLFVLVSTFAGSLTLAQEAYQHAIHKKYRFFSYGDTTLWI
jgi:S-adenosylmethionine:tRNA ribosyltransferase-isomerase